MRDARQIFDDGWFFPLCRAHTGITLANGVLGLMVWGDTSLRMTIGRTGFWDHRGGNAFSTKLDYATLKDWLTTGREEEVRQTFRPPQGGPEPRQLPCGVLDVAVGKRPRHATLDADTGTLKVWFDDVDEPALIAIDEHAERATIRLPAAFAKTAVMTFTPAFVAAGKRISDLGISAPTVTEQLDRLGKRIGEIICQSLPEDPSLSIAWQHNAGVIQLQTWLGEADPTTRVETINASPSPSSFWPRFWSEVPRVNLPAAQMNRLYDYGLFKFAGLTNPNGVAATLQGAWMEEYQVPPWSNDYHFNINLQMCYWPALSCNRTSHTAPLWRMIRGWFPKLREVGERFFGAPGAMMLPHAVDDHCEAIGGYWQGTVDHASTAWMAQLAWLDYRYSMDESHLREIAWPLLNGAFNGFWAMLEDHGASLRLPISVSPEYGDGAPGTWGANASFQLAAAHCVAGLLPRAAALLGESIDPRWADLVCRLPPYSLASITPSPWDKPGQHRQRISLWHGQDIEYSHRHHSHLAAIFPFATVDPHDPAHLDVVNESIDHWQNLGAGQWSAWCLPWSSILCARTNRADAALAWLNWFVENCANEGDNLSPSGLKGCMTNWGGWDDARRKPTEKFEIMQLDAHMGFLTAINELIVHCVGDEVRVLLAIPYRWKDFSFDRIGVEGGFQISGVVENRTLASLSIDSPHGGTLRLRHSFADAWTCDGRPGAGALLICATEPGQALTLRRG